MVSGSLRLQSLTRQCTPQLLSSRHQLAVCGQPLCSCFRVQNAKQTSDTPQSSIPCMSEATCLQGVGYTARNIPLVGDRRSLLRHGIPCRQRAVQQFTQSYSYLCSNEEDCVGCPQKPVFGHKAVSRSHNYRHCYCLKSTVPYVMTPSARFDIGVTQRLSLQQHCNVTMVICGAHAGWHRCRHRLGGFVKKMGVG
jgi:hypothetical protein